jgi:tRNA-dihydrouridine synthase
LNFWQELNFPFYALAPMEDVTDTVFRELILSVSSKENLQLVFSEFTSADGLIHYKGREAVGQRLLVSSGERKLLLEKNVKIIAQLWGSNPEHFFKASQIIKNEYNFDGIDVNMGCPVKKIVNQGGCSALILQPELAREIVHAVKEGSGLPVSVKTRIGYNSAETETWIGNLLRAEPSAIIVHGRSKKMKSEGFADWKEVGKAVAVRNRMGKITKIIGNGDILSISEATGKIKDYSCDGVMIGRGIFSNPWLFADKQVEKSSEEKIAFLLKHTRLFVDTWGERKNFAVLRRFFKVYLSGFPGAAGMRADLMLSDGLKEVTEYFMLKVNYDERI